MFSAIFSLPKPGHIAPGLGFVFRIIPPKAPRLQEMDFGTGEQIFYGEFDGRRRKRVLVKIIGT